MDRCPTPESLSCCELLTEFSGGLYHQDQALELLNVGCFISLFHLPGAADCVLCPCLAVVSQRTVCAGRGARAQACPWPVVCLVPLVRVQPHLRRGGHLSGETLQQSKVRHRHGKVVFVLCSRAGNEQGSICAGKCL